MLNIYIGIQVQGISKLDEFVYFCRKGEKYNEDEYSYKYTKIENVNNIIVFSCCKGQETGLYFFKNTVMNEIIVSKIDSNRLINRLKTARQDKTCHALDAEKLTEELRRAILCEPEKIPADVVTMNSTVKVFIPSMNVRKEITLVYPEEANLKQNKVSIFAPMAIGLLGYRKGDEIEWTVPKGKVKVIIEEIIYQPEASGNYEL